MRPSVEEGSVTFTCQPDESHDNPIGVVHGGLVCRLLDSALGCATQTTPPAGTGYTSIEIKVNYLRPVSHPPERAVPTSPASAPSGQPSAKAT